MHFLFFIFIFYILFFLNDELPVARPLAVGKSTGKQAVVVRTGAENRGGGSRVAGRPISSAGG